MSARRLLRPSLAALSLMALVLGVAALAPGAGATAAPGTLVLVVGEGTGTWATGVCADPGYPVLGSYACGGTGLPGAVNTGIAAGGTVSLSLPAGTYQAALAPMTLAALGAIGPVQVSAGQTVQCTLTMAEAPTCGPPTGPEPGTVVVKVAETSGSWATGFCADPGLPVLGSVTCGGTGLPGVLNLSLAPGTTFTLALAPGTYQAAIAPMSLASLSPIKPVVVVSGATVLCTFTLAGGPTCVPDDGDGIEEPAGVDGNGDGVVDSAQASVATFYPAVGTAPVTVAAPGPGYTLTGVTAAPVPALPALPTGTTLPAGVIGFALTLPSGVTTADVQVILPPGASPNGYVKLRGGAWSDFTSHATFAGDTVTLHLVDGDEFDTDPTPGVIGDPGGPARVAPPITGTFRSPVDGLPALNTGRAGRTYPVKFTLAAGDTPISSLSAVTSTTYRSVSCAEVETLLADALEVETTGATALTVANGVFHLNWATPSTPGCYRLTVTLADHGTLVANFKLR